MTTSTKSGLSKASALCDCVVETHFGDQRDQQCRMVAAVLGETAPTAFRMEVVLIPIRGFRGGGGRFIERAIFWML